MGKLIYLAEIRRTLEGRKFLAQRKNYIPEGRCNTEDYIGFTAVFLAERFGYASTASLNSKIATLNKKYEEKGSIPRKRSNRYPFYYDFRGIAYELIRLPYAVKATLDELAAVDTLAAVLTVENVKKHFLEVDARGILNCMKEADFFVKVKNKYSAAKMKDCFVHATKEYYGQLKGFKN